jgi:hypothetical protein
MLMPQFDIMTKEQLGTLMYTLQKKVDSGRHTYAEVEIMRAALQVWLARYE